MKPVKDIPLIARTVVAGTAILLLGGCAATPAAPSSAPSTAFPSPSPSERAVEVLDTVDGLPPDYTDFSLPDGHAPVSLAFIDPDDDAVLWISVWGSSTCPTVPVTYSVSPHGVLAITLGSIYTNTIPAPHDGYPCTDDRRLTSTAITVPADSELSHGVILEEVTTVSIPVRPETSPPPSPSPSPRPSSSSSPLERSVDVLDTVDGLPPGYTESPLPPGHNPVPLALTDPDDVGVLWIGTWGSSSCPTIPATYSVSAHGVLTLTVEPDYSQTTPDPDGNYACTADLALTSTAITVPDDVELSQCVVIREIITNLIPVRPHPGA